MIVPKERNMKKTLYAIIAVCLAVSAAHVQSTEEIIKRLEANQAFDTSRIEARLEVSNRFGTTNNDFTAWSRKGGDALLEINSGPDAGQKVLRKQDNIYLFYPDADDVIWLKGSALRDSLMGSDFSYEDLTDDRTLLDRFTAELKGESTIDGRAVWLLTLTAKKRTETYAKQDLWVDKEFYVTIKSILYSQAGKALREMRAENIRTISGKNMPFTTIMTDLLKKNTSTTMRIIKAEINIPIAEKYFNREELSW